MVRRITVHEIEAGYKVTPLSEWGKSPKPVEVKIASSVDMKTPPKTQIDTMQADQFFVYAPNFSSSTRPTCLINRLLRN